MKDRTARPLPTFFKPLAWAALLLTIATIAGLTIAASMRSGGDVAKNEKSIGVPIGVPEATSAPATVTAAARPSAAPTAAPASDAENANNTAGAVAANRPVLTSDPDPTAPVDIAAPSSEPAAAATGAQQSNQVASNNSAPATTSRTEPAADRPADRSADRRDATAQPRVVASNNQASPAEEPMPPGAGPDQAPAQGLPAEISETANSYAVKRPTNNNDDNAPERASTSESARSFEQTTAPKTVRAKSEPTTVASAATPRPKKSSSAAAAPAPKRTRSEDERVADARRAMPPMPRGAVRAEYLGTTPDGNLVFGLPSEQRGYVAPERRRRSRRPVDVLDAEPAVLPALPPDDE